MKSTYSTLMSSRFFNPAFNSAIFDGPVRIYFAQFQEAMALKIYFSLQQKYADAILRAKDYNKRTGANILVMLYPTRDSFEMSFEQSQEFLLKGNLLSDTVVGINGPFEDEKLDQVLSVIAEAMAEWEKSNDSVAVPEFVEAII